MHTRPVRHVLPHIVYTDIHQLHRIKRRAAQIRCGSGVGGAAREGEIDPGIREAVRLEHAIVIGGMPGDRRVHVIEQTRANHECLGSTPLFCRTAVVADATGRSCPLQPVLYRRCGHESRRTQKVVTAAMPSAVKLRRRPRLRHAGLLTQRRKRIIFAQNRNHRAVSARFSHHRCRNTGEVTRDAKALCLHLRQMRLYRAALGIGDLGRVKHLIGQRHVRHPPLLHQIPDLCAVLHAMPLSFGS